MKRGMYAKSLNDWVKQFQVMLYMFGLLKKYKIYKSEFAKRHVKYLGHSLFESSLHGNQDHNAVLIISHKLALRLSFSSGCWVLAKFFSRECNHNETLLRWVKIIIDYKLKREDNCYVSLILYHNLKEKLSIQDVYVELKNEKMIYSVYLVTRIFAIWNSKIDLQSILSTYKSSLQPNFAHHVSLASVNEPLKSFVRDMRDIEAILQHYFTCPRYLHVGDVIAISIPIPQGILHDSLDYIFWPKFLYFFVVSINGSKDTTASTPGYLISKDRTTLYLSGTENTKFPCLHNAVSPAEEPVPPCLESVFSKICTIFESYQPLHVLYPLKSKGFGKCKEIDESEKAKTVKTSINNSHVPNPSFFDYSGHILLIGPKGSGKGKIIKLLAEKFSNCIQWIDCLSLKGDTSAAAAGKIRQAFANVQLYTIIVLTRIGSLSEDRDGNNDPRVFIALTEQFQKLSALKLHPFIIATNENQDSVSDDLWSLFTYTFVITCPTQEERARTLLWLFCGYFQLDLNLSERIFKENAQLLSVVSHRTAGFYFGDLEEYVLRVHRCVLDRIINKTDQDSEKGQFDRVPVQKDFLKALDEMQEQRSEALGLPRIPKVQWKDVGGLEEAKKELINTIELPIKYPNLISKAFRRSGILLYGPPGTGKTLLAKSVASECGLNFLSVKGPELINMYIGQSEENVRYAFVRAKTASPCVLFFDEVDSLAPNRGRSGDSGGVMDRIVSALLAELDGISSSADVFVLAATNRPDLLDPALLRPGRFEKHIFLGLSETREDQLKILKVATSKIPLDESVSLERVVDRLPFTLTGADFVALATDAFYIATRRVIAMLQEGEKSKEHYDDDVKVEVYESDLDEASQKLKPSVSESELKMYQRMRNGKGGFGLVS